MSYRRKQCHQVLSHGYRQRSKDAGRVFALHISTDTGFCFVTSSTSTSSRCQSPRGVLWEDMQGLRESVRRAVDLSSPVCGIIVNDIIELTD